MSSDSIQYGGFWRRLSAGILDFLVFLPLMVVWATLTPPNKTAYLAVELFAAVLFVLYPVLLHAKYGATLGKYLMGLKLVRVDLSPIGMNESLIRSSVDIGFQAFWTVVTFLAVLKIEPTLFQFLSAGEFGALQAEITKREESIVPYWKVVSVFPTLWALAEMVSLLFSKKKRAIHDYMAGTVVIVWRPEKEKGATPVED